MKSTVISRHKFNKLKQYYLDDNIFNTECMLYILNEKDKWSKETKLIKKLYVNDGLTFGNKLLTINSLIDKKELIDIPKLVFPEKLVIIDNTVVGFTIPLIPSYNLQTLLSSPKLTDTQKIIYLKEVGEILEKMHEARKNNSISNFYLNDCHENNFIVGKKDNKVYGVDLDSCSIDNNLPFGSRYLSVFSPIYEYQPKYDHKLNLSAGGSYIPNENTDLFCYNIMILNYLYQGKANYLSLEDFYNYLDYLYSIGLNHELIDSFARLYSYQNNINPYQLLDYILELKNKTTETSYKIKKLIK
jgi:hypothetical protein